MSEILMDTELDDEQRKFAENIQRSANALLTVINDILDISKVESGRLDIEEVQFSLPLVVQDVTKMLSFDIERRKLAFECNTNYGEAGDNMTVIGDPGRIRQILTNLLTNSIKFTHAGFIKLHVQVENEDEDSIFVRFEVKDSGIGIDDDVQQKLFQPFTQADSSTARRFGGTGLGLTISKNVRSLVSSLRFRPIANSRNVVGRLDGWFHWTLLEPRRRNDSLLHHSLPPTSIPQWLPPVFGY